MQTSQTLRRGTVRRWSSWYETLIVLATLLTGTVTLQAQESSSDRTMTQSSTASTAEAAAAAPSISGNEQIYRAYQKEYAFLMSERAALQKRLKEIDAGRAHRLTELDGAINSLQNSLIKTSIQIESAQSRLHATDSQKLDAEEAADLLDSTLAQARMSLAKYNVSLPDVDMADRSQKEQAIAAVFTNSRTILKKINSIYTEQGSFFLSDGSKVEGTIVHIGNIGRYGVSSAGSGTLAPAGGGYFSLWDTKSGVVAQSLADGRTPAVFPLYLSDSPTKAAVSHEGKTVGEVIESGGFIAYIIVGLGILALLMIIGRTFFLWNSSTDTATLAEKVIPLLQKGEKAKAIDMLNPSHGAASRVMATAVRNLDADPEHLEDIIAESILHETPYLERFEAAITVFAAVAPLLGLLGTVTGMISTFDVITEYGTGDPKLLSGGISEALVTTELGLMVAIPALLLGNLLSGWSDRIKAGMEGAALKISNVARTFKTECVAQV